MKKDKINLPTHLTLFRIYLVPIFVAVLLTRFEGKEIIGVIIFWIASITDFLDGYIARRNKQVTNLGKLLDPIADKFLITGAFISLVELGLAPAWMVVIIIGREFAISGLRQVALSYRVMIPASRLGKTKMISQIVAISFLILGRYHIPFFNPQLENGVFLFEQLGIWTLWVVVVFAIVSSVDYFVTFWKKTGDLLLAEKGSDE